MDPLRIIEAAYTWNLRDEDWLAGLIHAAAPYSTGGGVLAFTIAGERTEVEAIACSPDIAPKTAPSVSRFCAAVSLPVAHALFAPTEFAGNAGWRVERIARERGTTLDGLSGGVRLPPMWAVIAGEPAERSILLGFPAPRRISPTDPFPGAHGRVLGLVGAHLGAALRLRTAISPNVVVEAANDPLTEAVLEPNGRVVHATGEARTKAMRGSLSEAIMRSERARGRLRRVDGAEATQLWTALVEGRWSVLETVERDGKRYLLARRNGLGARDLLALTKEESDVVWLAAQGHSNKFIAYELGLTETKVTRRLAKAMRKLRVGSRRDLLRKLGMPHDPSGLEDGEQMT